MWAARGIPDMQPWLIVLLYVGGMSLVILEALLPGMVLGFFGMTGIVISIVYGFQENWMIGTAQIGIAVVVIPTLFWLAFQRLTMKTDLSVASGGVSFAKEYEIYLGREAEALTDLRPGGIVLMDGKKLDVVTGGEMIQKGKRVQVFKVEGNRVVVRMV